MQILFSHRLNSIISETKSLRGRIQFTFNDADLNFADDLYEPPINCHPLLVQRVQMMKDLRYIQNLHSKKLTNIKLVISGGAADAEIFFDFIQLFNLESLEIDVSQTNRQMCSSYQVNLRDLLATQPNLKRLKVIGSQRYYNTDLFSHNIATPSTSNRNFFQLESLTYTRGKMFNDSDDDEDFDDDDDMMGVHSHNTQVFMANFVNLVIFNGLQIRELHLEHPNLKANALIFLLQNLKLLEILKIAINYMYPQEVDKIDFYTLEMRSMEPLQHLKQLFILNDETTNSTKSLFLKKMLSVSPNLEKFAICYGYFDGSLALWMEKFNKKLKYITDGGDLIASDMITHSEFSQLKSLRVTKSLFMSNNNLYHVLSNMTVFFRNNANVEELIFEIYGTGGSNVTIGNLRKYFERFAQDSNLRRMFFIFTGQTEYLRKIIVKLVGEYVWKRLEMVELRSYGKMPIVLRNIEVENLPTSSSSTESEAESYQIM